MLPPDAELPLSLCPRCGFTLAPGDEQCGSCGVDLVQARLEALYVPPVAVPPPSPARLGREAALWVGAMVVLVLGGYGLGRVIPDSDKQGLYALFCLVVIFTVLLWRRSAPPRDRE